MAQKSASRCDGCGRAVQSFLVARSGFYCQPCRAKLPRAHCESCGKRMVLLPGAVAKLCRRCASVAPWIGKPCSHCGRPVDRTGIVFEGRPYCRPCKRLAVAAKQCHYCGHWSVRVHRSPANGLEYPACQACIKQHTRKCGLCYQRCKIAGTLDGIDVCSVCFQRGTTATSLCESCGQMTHAPNTSRCMGCINLRLAKASVRHAEATLKTEWAKQLLQAFIADAGFRDDPGRVAELVKRNIEAFRLFEGAVTSVDQLTVHVVLDAFSGDRTQKRFRSVKNWLATTRGLQFSGRDSDWHRHQTAVRRKLDNACAPWARDTLQAFLEHLYNRRDRYRKAGVIRRGNTPMATRSIELAVGYASRLLTYCASDGVASAPGVDQALLDAYAASTPKTYQSLGAFIRFLNRTSHRMNPLTLPSKARARSSAANKLPTEIQASIAQWCMAAQDPVDVRNACITLLVLLYAQRASAVIRLRRSALTWGGNELQIDFGRGAFPIHPDVAALIRRWLDHWYAPSKFITPDTSEYVFPGIEPTRSYSRISFMNWLKARFQVLPRQLYATSVHALLNAGAKSPSLLTDCFGMSKETALRYWRDSGQDLSSYVFADGIARLREGGFLVLDDRKI